MASDRGDGHSAPDSQPTLKVMRLYKPKLHVAMPVPSLGAGDPCALSNLFILPDSFGNIYLGETFCSYISVLNQFQHDLKHVGLSVSPSASIIRVITSVLCAGPAANSQWAVGSRRCARIPGRGDPSKPSGGIQGWV